jgi:hypothetical protein
VVARALAAVPARRLRTRAFIIGLPMCEETLG